MSAVEGTSIAKPLGNEETPTQHPLKETGEHTTVLGFRKLCSIQWNGGRELANCDTANEAADDEHSHVDGTSLESAAEDRNESSDQYGPAATQLVGEQHVEDGTSDSSALEGGDDTTSRRVIGIGEILLECIKGDGGGDDTRVVTKQEATGGQKDRREDSGCETHLVGVREALAMVFRQGHWRLCILSHHRNSRQNDLGLYPGLTHAEGLQDRACMYGATSASDLSWHSPSAASGVDMTDWQEWSD